MSATAVAEQTKPEKKATPQERVVEPVDPKLVLLDHDGFITRSWNVTLPEGTVAQDLNDHPDMWRRVQADLLKAFRPHDRLTIFGFDHSWCIDVIVSGATQTAVSVATVKMINGLPARTAGLPETEDFRVAWVGAGYVVIDKKDGRRRSQPVVSLGEATREMHALYPRRVNDR